MEKCTRVGCQDLIGIDAHSPETLKDKSNEIIAKRILEDRGINLEYLDSFEPLGIGKKLQGNTMKKQ